ncbi:MAG TPA: VWA domain-containing protein [Bacteroidia bacterium]|jgi:Mg-chelatase subunit ChlD
MNRPLFLLFIFISVTAPAQNLVMNPGFEDTTRAPSVGYNQKGAGTPLVKGWWVATSGTSDYYNSDRSRNYAATDPKSELVPKAHSGQGRAGFIAYTGAGTWKNIWSEYLESQLIQPLQAGKKYCVSFYVKLDSGSGYSASDLGLCFSGNEIVSYRHFALRNEPQVVCRDVKLLRDRSGWSKICGYYTAHGGERFITIGCFEFNGLCPTEKKLERLKYPTFKKMAYYYLDDVDVHEVISNENCCETRNAGVVALRNFVLLVDASGSMHDSHYIELVQQEVFNLTAALAPGDRLSILLFGTDTKLLLKKCMAHQRDSVRLALNDIARAGGTNINIGLNGAYALMDECYMSGLDNRVVLFTDGKFNMEKGEVEMIEKHFKEKLISLHCIQFGKEHNRALKNCASRTHGSYERTDQYSLAYVLHKQVTFPECSKEINRRRHRAWWRMFSGYTLLIGGVEALVIVLVVDHSREHQ